MSVELPMRASDLLTHAGNRPTHTCLYGTEDTADDLAAATAASPLASKAMESPFASETSQETPSQAKRGRRKAIRKLTAPEAHAEAGAPSTTAPLAVAPSARARSRTDSMLAQADATPEPEVGANMESGEGAADAGDTWGLAAARLDMARKASTGDGSRLERRADSDDSNLRSVAQSEQQAQAGSSRAEADVHGVMPSYGVQALQGPRAVPSASTASKPPHRLSKVTGMLASAVIHLMLASAESLLFAIGVTD